MLSGKVNPASGIFLGRNHWGYQDKIDVVVTPNNKSDTEYSADELRKLYGASDSDPVSTTFSDEPPTDF